MNKFSGKISYIIITMFMGAIIVSFALTGFQDFNTNRNAVASVDGTPVTIREYQRAYDAQVNRLSQMFGGKSLTSQQIKQFRIKENVLNNLVQQKLLLNFAKDLKLETGKSEIKNSIKNSKFFQTGDKFDVTKYKNLLAANGYSPAKYETLVADDMSRIKLDKLLASATLSQTYINEIMAIKNSTAKVTAVSFQKEAMTKNVKVSNAKITEFLADKKNEAVLASLFKAQEAKYKKSNLTLKNESVRKELATSHLQRTMRKELGEFNASLAKQLDELLKAGNISKIESLSKKYGFVVEKDLPVNLFDLRIKSIELERPVFEKIFKNQDVTTVTMKDSPVMTYLVKVNSFEKVKSDAKAAETETNRLQSMQRNSLMMGLIQYLQKNSKVVTYSNLL